MIIRQSTPEDIPNIITLLKESIGEVLTPKTEGYFVWKHEKIHLAVPKYCCN
jgi:hypothetical protein